MDRTVADDTLVTDTVRNPPAVAKIPLKIYVPTPLPPPLPPPSTTHMPSPLPPTLLTENLLIIALPTYTSDWVSDKEDYVMVKFHQNKRKKYVQGTKLKSVPFNQ